MIENKEENNIENSHINEEIEIPNIKHIVLSGGGTIGFHQYGVLRESNKQGFWKIENIESIYGVSVGSFVGVMLCLNLDWDIIDDYLIKRPWNKTVNITLDSLIQSFDYRGILDKTLFQKMLYPMFRAKDINVECTMKELYEITKIDLHIFTVELNQYKLIDICHTNYPDWKVEDAVYASCCLPMLFRPIIENNCCYVDGGFIINYPINQCIQSGKKINEIFGIYRLCSDLGFVNENSNLFDYILIAIKKIITETNVGGKIQYEIDLDANGLTLNDAFDFINTAEKRIEWIQFGVERCKKFLQDIHWNYALD